MNLKDILGAYSNDWDHLFLIEYEALALVALGLLAFKLYRSYGFLVGLSSLWFGFSALRIFATAHTAFPDWQLALTNAIDSSSAFALVLFLLYIPAVRALSIQTWRGVFQAAVVVNALALISSTLLSTHPQGLLMNLSMSGCLSATLLPLCGRRPWVACLVLASVFFARHSLPVATLCVILGVYAIRTRRWSMLGLGLSMSVGILAFVGIHGIFDTSGRWITWRDSMHFWQSANPFFGLGTGTYFLLGPMLTSPRGEIFPFMHSDYLQVLFEQGIIGLGLLLLLYGVALWRSRRRSPLFYSLVGYGAYGGANMPMRYPLTALLGVFLLHWAFQKEGVHGRTDRSQDGKD